jgi:hypothetical protein
MVQVKLLAHDTSHPVAFRANGRPRAIARPAMEVVFRSPLARLLPHRHVTRTLLAATSSSFEGIPAPIGATTYAPDANGDIGLTQYVQAVTSKLAVFSRAAPHTLLGIVTSSQFWAGLGNPGDAATLCSSNPQGDPVVQYDRLADRWVFSEFAFTRDGAGNPVAPFVQCVAVSTSPDATGTWYRYAFQPTSAYFPDAPQLGIWPDGYYFSYNQFTVGGGAFVGAGALALERTKMLTGDDAQARFIDLHPVTPEVGGIQPATVTSPTPPPSPIGPELYLQSLNGATGDIIQLWAFKVDWTTNVVGSSTFHPVLQFAVNPFSSTFCGTLACIDQPPIPGPLNTTTAAPPLQQGAAVVDSASLVIPQLSYHLAYLHDAGGAQHLVATQTVNEGGSRAGVRWYDLTNTNTGLPANWSLHDQGDYAPGSTDSRFMSSGGIDNSGGLALAYSVSSLSTAPSLFFTGRAPGDTPGQMPVTEQTLFPGSIQQRDSSLWGAYSSLSLDPIGQCDFWFTGEHAGSQGWGTTIAKFNLGTCTAVTPTPPVLTADSTTSEPIVREADTITAVSGSWTGSTSVTGQWRRCDQWGFACIDIAGQTASTHVFSALDAAGDRTVRYQEIAIGPNGTSIASSKPTPTIVQSLPPVNTVLPVATGTAQAGQTLSTTDGTWTSSSPVSFIYRWRRCTSSTSCTSIPGANSSSYVLAAADVGDTVDVIVSATNTGGATLANANPTVAVAAAPAGSGGGGGGGTTTTTTTTTATTGTTTPDLQLSGSASPSAAATGAVVTLALGVTDVNAQLAQGVVLTVALPTGLQYVSGSADRGSGCTASGTQVTCSLDFLSGAAPRANVQILVKVLTAARYVVTASVTAQQGVLSAAHSTGTLTLTPAATQTTPTPAPTPKPPAKPKPKPKPKGPDKTRPHSHGFASTGTRGHTAKLRFRISDDRGVAKAVATVKRNGERIATARTGLGHVVLGTTYFVGWHVALKDPKGRYTFCVVASDRAGNHSRASCARLTIK